jgi:hypothetical protein
MIDWSELLSAVLMAVLSLVLPFVARALVRLLVAKWGEVQSKMTTQQLAVLNVVTTLAVQAAEQLGLSEQIKDKKAYALQVAYQWLKDKGIDIDLNYLDAAIEAAVLEEFNRDKPALPAPAE